MQLAPPPRVREKRLDKRLRTRRGNAANKRSISVGIEVFLCSAGLIVGWAYLLISILGVGEQEGKVRRYQYGYPMKQELKLPTPIIVAGLPKSGTTSVTEYFRCGAVKSSHFACEVDHVGIYGSVQSATSWRNCRLPKGAGGPKSDGSKIPLCAVCVERNILRGRPPLEGCGPYEVWGELDSAEHPLPVMKKGDENDFAAIQPLCSYPQITHLDKIHEAYPNATFVLNLRPVDKWIKSVSKWNGDYSRTDQGYLRQVLTKCDLPGLPAGVGDIDEELAAFYNGQSERIRDFVRRHPSHALVEVNVEDKKAGEMMEEKFGIVGKCWVKQNSSPNDEEEVDSLHKLRQSLEDPKQIMQTESKPQFDPPKTSGKQLRKTYITSRSEPSGDDDEIVDYPECTDVANIFPPRASSANTR